MPFTSRRHCGGAPARKPLLTWSTAATWTRRGCSPTRRCAIYTIPGTCQSHGLQRSSGDQADDHHHDTPDHATERSRSAENGCHHHHSADLPVGQGLDETLALGPHNAKRVISWPSFMDAAYRYCYKYPNRADGEFPLSGVCERAANGKIASTGYPRDTGNQEVYLEFTGECYVHGIMDGEA